MPKLPNLFYYECIDEFENLTEEDFKHYTTAFLIALMGLETYKEMIKDNPLGQLTYNSFKNLPPAIRIKYETNILSKYARVVKWWQKHEKLDN